MSVIRWEEPPPSAKGPGNTKWPVVLNALKERPGEWALVLEGVNVANAYGLSKRFPDYEFTSRAGEGGDRAHGLIYGRYPDDRAAS